MTVEMPLNLPETDMPLSGRLEKSNEKLIRQARHSHSAKMQIDLTPLEEMDPQLAVMVAQELREQAAQEALFAELEQIEAAKLNRGETVRSIEGVGQQVLAISQSAFIYYKTIEQLDFSNPRDIKWLTTRYPEMKVNCIGTKDQFASAEIPKAKAGRCAVNNGEPRRPALAVGTTRHVRETIRYPETKPETARTE